MTDITTQYLGLKLSNPVIIGSSGLTGTADKIIKLAEAGAGAVVVKSLFEEQIRIDAGTMFMHADYPEALDYLNTYTRDNALESYLKMIENARKRIKIPIIASINCVSSHEWISFATAIEDAGADAMELNLFIMPHEIHKDARYYEQTYFDIIDQVKKRISIPVSVKLGQHFVNIPSLVDNLYARGARGVVLFNRFYAPDIDIDKLSFTNAKVLSNPDDIRNSLRWVGIVSALVDKIDICASTGVHDGKALIKQILAGAKAVQVCSTIYMYGEEQIAKMIEELKDWMNRFNFNTIDEFRGRLNYKNIPDPGIFERVQFMRYFSNME